MSSNLDLNASWRKNKLFCFNHIQHLLVLHLMINFIQVSYHQCCVDLRRMCDECPKKLKTDNMIILSREIAGVRKSTFWCFTSLTCFWCTSEGFYTINIYRPWLSKPRTLGLAAGFWDPGRIVRVSWHWRVCGQWPGRLPPSRFCLGTF